MIKKINNQRTSVINIFIDPEGGFLNLNLTDKEGGVLYVPGGEQVVPLMGEIIAKSRNTFFILGQDYHPENHISFMINHPGVMDYRIEKFKSFLAQHGQSEPENIYEAAQKPVHFFNGPNAAPENFPFEEMVMDENRNIIGVKESDGRIRKVDIKTLDTLTPSETDRGRISFVKNSYFDKTYDELINAGKALTTQNLWTMHCVQETPSSLYPDEMGLSKGLTQSLIDDPKSKYIHYHDPETGNVFYVIRKGMDSEVDSYGIGVENDGETMTAAWDVFRVIAQQLKQQACDNVIINIGGLATNFCVEFSANNTADFLAGHFKMRNMGVEINFVPEISRGIPIAGDENVPFSENGTPIRLKQSRGINSIAKDQVIEMSASVDQSVVKKKKHPEPKR